MLSDPRSERAQFEVWCPRCNVSFPIGTRRCLHCGGATVPPNAIHEETATIDFVGNAAGPSIFEQRDELTMRPEELEENRGERGLGKSILGSLGSLLWIALFIAISLANRTCGGGE